MNDADIIQQAKQTLAQACVDTGIQPSEEALFWLLGLVWGESRMGQTPDWVIPNQKNTSQSNPDAPPGPSHNWGAVRATGAAPFIIHGDLNADRSPGDFKFARFTTQLDGAKHFLRTIARNSARAVIGGQGTARDLAAAMFANSYYTGTCPPNCTPEAKINAYTNMILSQANKVRKALGVPLSQTPLQPGSTYVTPTDQANSFPWLAAGILGAVGIGGTLYLAHRNPYGLAGRVVDHVTDVPHHVTDAAYSLARHFAR